MKSHSSNYYHDRHFDVVIMYGKFVPGLIQLA
jgi:hypothetical protein